MQIKVSLFHVLHVFSIISFGFTKSEHVASKIKASQKDSEAESYFNARVKRSSVNENDIGGANENGEPLVQTTPKPVSNEIQYLESGTNSRWEISVKPIIGENNNNNEHVNQVYNRTSDSAGNGTDTNNDTKTNSNSTSGQNDFNLETTSAIQGTINSTESNIVNTSSSYTINAEYSTAITSEPNVTFSTTESSTVIAINMSSSKTSESNTLNTTAVNTLEISTVKTSENNTTTIEAGAISSSTISHSFENTSHSVQDQVTSDLVSYTATPTYLSESDKAFNGTTIDTEINHAVTDASTITVQIDSNNTMVGAIFDNTSSIHTADNTTAADSLIVTDTTTQMILNYTADFLEKSQNVTDNVTDVTEDLFDEPSPEPDPLNETNNRTNEAATISTFTTTSTQTTTKPASSSTDGKSLNHLIQGFSLIPVELGKFDNRNYFKLQIFCFS